jgi:hypothetical protein
MRTTLMARIQLVASQLKIENTIRGLMRVCGLKIVRSRQFAAIDLLHASSSYSKRRRSLNCPQLLSRCRECEKECAVNGRRRTGPWQRRPGAPISAAA